MNRERKKPFKIWVSDNELEEFQLCKSLLEKSTTETVMTLLDKFITNEENFMWKKEKHCLCGFKFTARETDLFVNRNASIGPRHACRFSCPLCHREFLARYVPMVIQLDYEQDSEDEDSVQHCNGGATAILKLKASIGEDRYFAAEKRIPNHPQRRYYSEQITNDFINKFINEEDFVGPFAKSILQDSLSRDVDCYRPEVCAILNKIINENRNKSMGSDITPLEYERRVIAFLQSRGASHTEQKESKD